MNYLSRFIFVLAGLVASGAVSAHTGIHSSGGFAAGFTHPFMGLDHLLAMVAVGMWAVQLGGRYLLVVPAVFVASMAVGATLGTASVAVPQVEGVAALSVLVLGLLVALSTRAAWYWAIPLIAAFALFHGQMHGAEMPAFAARWQYFAGVLIATATLHALGVGSGAALKEHTGLLRIGGAAISLFGGWLLLSA
jgi:urease accessory protein